MFVPKNVHIGKIIDWYYCDCLSLNFLLFSFLHFVYILKSQLLFWNCGAEWCNENRFGKFINLCVHRSSKYNHSYETREAMKII